MGYDGFVTSSRPGLNGSDADFAPMEMRSVDTIPVGPNWQYEPKWDGFRALVHRDGDDVAIISKNGQPLSRYFPEIVAAVAAVDRDHFSLDGELVVPRAGALSFDALQQRIHPAATRVAMLARTTPAYYLVFDLLREDGDALVELPLQERRQRLELFSAGFPAKGTLRLSPVTTERAVVDAWFERVGGALDGVIAKRRDRPYASGKSDAAVKVKKTRSADCVIGGFRYAAGGQDRIGNLLLGLYDDDGLLDYIGFCSAFAAPERIALIDRLRPYAGGSGFTGGAPDVAPSRWSRDPERDRSYVALRPELVLEVAFDQVTGGRIRHGTKPLRWRTDKSPQQCTVDQLETAGSVLGLLEN
jgi:ATP-dependent DNA ligase